MLRSKISVKAIREWIVCRSDMASSSSGSFEDSYLMSSPHQLVRAGKPGYAGADYNYTSSSHPTDCAANESGWLRQSQTAEHRSSHSQNVSPIHFDLSSSMRTALTSLIFRVRTGLLLPLRQIAMVKARGSSKSDQEWHSRIPIKIKAEQIRSGLIGHGRVEKPSKSSHAF